MRGRCVLESNYALTSPIFEFQVRHVSENPVVCYQYGIDAPGMCSDHQVHWGERLSLVL